MSWFEKNTGNKNGTGTGGVGFIVIPENVSDMGAYVEQCYRSNEVTLAGDGYGVMSHVKVVDGVMERIKFPNNDKGKGSLVMWVRESFYNRPIVVGVLSDGNTPSEQGAGQGTQTQDYGGISISVLQDAMNGLLQLYACGNSAKPVKVLIKAAGSDEDDVEIQSSNKIGAVSKVFSVESTESFIVKINNGEQEIITIEGDEEKLHFKDYNGNELMINNLEDEEQELKKYIELKDTFGRLIHFDEEKAQYHDELGNEALFNQDNIQFRCNKFNLGEGAEPMVLGNTLKNLLEQLCSAINAITVPTAHGPSGTPLNSAQISAISGKLSTILSHLSNTD